MAARRVDVIMLFDVVVDLARRGAKQDECPRQSDGREFPLVDRSTEDGTKEDTLMEDIKHTSIMHTHCKGI